MTLAQKKNSPLPAPIEEKPLDVTKDLAEAPQVEDVLEKAKLVLTKKVKQSQRLTWYCTDCGAPNCQNNPGFSYGQEIGGHINVTVVDGEFTDRNGNPLSPNAQRLMDEYARREVANGTSDEQESNAETLEQMKAYKES